MTYAMCESQCDTPESRDINNKAFWDKLGEIFKVTMEMVTEKAVEMGIDLNAIDHEKFEKQENHVHEIVESRPYTQAAKAYIKMVNDWFESNRELLKDKGDELQSQADAQIPGTKPADDAASIKDCLEVIGWYQPQIYVKLCRAASGMIRGELEDDIEYFPEDAKGSAGVAVLGIERSIAAWGRLLGQFPDQERSILDLLVHLKSLLQQVKAEFPKTTLR